MSTSDNDTDARFLPMLEPLCAATASQLSSVKTFPSDQLLIDIDEEGRRFEVRFITQDDDGTEMVGWAPSGAASQLLRRFPEAYKHPDKRSFHWVLAGTDVSALIIHHAWPAHQLRFLSDEAGTLYEFLLRRFLLQTRNSALVASFKIENHPPLMPPDFIDHPNYPAAPYQKVGLLCSLERDASALFMEQGTGKTYVAVALVCLEALRKWREHPNESYRVLVVCPRQVRTNWCREFARFATVPGKTTIIRGDKLGRIKSIVAATRQEPNTLFTVAVCSFDSVDGTWEALSMVPWDRLIIDESQKAKSPKSKRFKTLRMLRDHCRRRLILTGTPIANSLMDLWAQLELIGDGLSGFLTFENFAKFYGEWKRVGEEHGVTKLVSIRNIPLIQERLTRLAFMITKREAGLNLPDLVEDVVDVAMTKRQREFYVKLRDELAIEIEEELNRTNDEPSARVLSAEHVLTRLLRLSQITSGFYKYDDCRDDDGNLVATGATQNIDPIIHNPKLKILIEMLSVRAEFVGDEDDYEENEQARDPKAKAIVWATWRQDEVNIRAALTAAGIGHVVYTGSDDARDWAIRQFNRDPSIRVIVGNPKKLGEGANLLGYDYDETEPKLDTYCDLEIFYSENWSVLERGQAMARAHRRGTRRTVRVATLCVSGTIDEEIYDRLQAKVNQANLIQDIRDILRRIIELNPTDD